MFSTKKKRKIIDDATRCKSESEAQEREERREENCKHPRRGEEVGWRRRCRVACGLERKKKEAAKVWAKYFSFFLFFPTPSPPPPRQGFRPKVASHSTKAKSPRGTLKAWRIPGLGTEWPLVPGQAWPITVCHCRSPETQHGRCWIIRCIRLNPARITCLLIAGC